MTYGKNKHILPLSKGSSFTQTSESKESAFRVRGAERKKAVGRKIVVERKIALEKKKAAGSLGEKFQDNL